jgi:hypothetical protein
MPYDDWSPRVKNQMTNRGLVENRRRREGNILQPASDGSAITPVHAISDRSYQVRFKRADLPPELVIAETIEFHGEHLVFLRSDGSLAALFVFEIVESWPEVNL